MAVDTLTPVLRETRLPETGVPAAAATPDSAPPTKRVLLVRCCRPDVLASAVASVRERWPGASVSLLQPAHTAAATTGIDDVMRVDARWLGLTTIPRSMWRRLWSLAPDVVVVPQMHGDGAAYLNVYRVATAVGAPVIAVYDAAEGLQPRPRRAFHRHHLLALRKYLFSPLDAPMALLLMALACVRPRIRRPAPRARARILHVVTSFGVGGAQVQLSELVRRSSADGHDVDVLVLSRGDGAFSSRWLAGTGTRLHYVDAWPRLAPSILEIARHCRRGRYDVVHTWLFLANVLGVTGAALAGTPRIVASVRNLSLWKRAWARQWWFRVADALSSFAADAVTVNARPLVADHARWAAVPRSRIQIVPNGLDASALPEPDEAARAFTRHAAGTVARPIVVTVGRLAEEKDHETLLHAWARFQRDHSAARLVIAGDGPLRHHLQALASSLGVTDSVRWLGEHGEARRLIAGADVFVLSSVIEGCANVLLEAAMTGIPFVATDVGAAAEIAADTSWLAPPRDADTLADRLGDMCRDLATARLAAAAHRGTIRARYAPARMAACWHAIYQGREHAA